MLARVQRNLSQVCQVRSISTAPPTMDNASAEKITSMPVAACVVPPGMARR
jgi:hypothetical protein